MKRNLVALLPLLSFCTFPINSAEPLKKDSPLNVVWLSCEDMGPILGCYDNDIIKTPHLDKLASEGVRYTNAYSTVGLVRQVDFL